MLLAGLGTPTIVWRFAAPKSTSIRSVLYPCLANRYPRLPVKKLFPVPPFPPPMGQILGAELSMPFRRSNKKLTVSSSYQKHFIHSFSGRNYVYEVPAPVKLI
jgi:hypothetical protein